MKASLLPIYRAVAEGRLTQAEALMRIKALKRQASDAQGVVLATREWAAGSAPASPSGSAAGREPDTVVLWGVPQEAAASLKAQLRGCRTIDFATIDSAGMDEVFTRAALNCFDAIKSMLAELAGSTDGVRVLLIAAEGPESAVASGFEAMCRTAMEENPAFVARTVRVPTDIEPSELLRLVRDESSDASQHGAVRYVREDGVLRRQVPCWRVLDKRIEDDAPSASPAVFKEGGCYLITGGAGGVGLHFAREVVAQTGRARIVLAGRSPELRPDTAKALEALRTPGHRLDYVALDVAQAEEVDALAERLRSEGQPLRGIIHCAGITRDNFIIRKSPAEFASVLAPKVAGLVNLDRATREAPLDFFLFCSSFAACWGIVGQVDYAAANAFMDAFAGHRNRMVDRGERSGLTLSVNWPLWRDGGMTLDAATRERLQSHTGMRPLSTSAAMWAVRRGFGISCERMLVMEGDLSAMQGLLEPAEPARDVSPGRAVIIEAPGGPGQVGVRFDEEFKARSLEYIRQQFSQVLRVPLARLRPEAPLEQYGIDSILAMKLVNHLESIFGKLPKTLAFEYQTIAQLNEYFCTSHADRLAGILTPEVTPAQTAAEGPAGAATASPVPGKRIKPGRPERAAAQPRSPETEHRSTSDAARLAEPIAIVGLSGRYPDAWDLDEYWQNLRQGKDCIREIPPERWRWQDYYRDVAAGEQIAAGQHRSKWGGFIPGADEFDARFFNVMPRDAEQIDPQERLFLQYAWMAIEDAGYTRAAMQERRGGQVGVYAGVMYGEYNRSGSLASIANRVSYVMNLHGPSLTLDTMCSSSLTAIHVACQDLKLGRTDMALAGGVNLSIHPGKYGMLSAGQFISGSGHCQSFGEGGDGYIPGEGVGVVVLKRLSDAVRDGDAIHAVIRGSALNHGGKTNGYTVPNPQAQAAVIADALKQAGVDARQVSYIEAHGTGTKLGDPIEIAAISKAFREYTADTQFCLLGSAKSNIGHCESAAGIAGLTKVILQMRHRQIVPSLHSERLNPNIDFEATPFEVNQRLHAWEAPVVDGRQVPLIAGISSFGAGGGNAHLVVEAYSGDTRVSDDAAPCAVVLSARTLPQLRQKAEDLKAFVEKHADVDLRSLSYTLQVGREAMDERLGMRVKSRSELLGKLAAFLASDSPEDGALADDLYYAQSRRHRDAIALFGIDKDLQASVDGWFGAGKLSRLLDVWTKGLDVDWLKLYGPSRPGRMHAPVYPFARERYWREEPADAAGVAAPAAHALHSLVHRNASKPGLQRYRSMFRADDPRVAGLRLLGHCALPHGLQIEAARAALADALPALQEGAWELQQVRFAAPGTMQAPATLDIAVMPPGKGRRPSLHSAAFELSADDAEGLVLCQGFAEPCPEAEAPMLDITALERGASPMFAGQDAILDACRAIGLEVDAVYQSAETLHRSGDGLWLSFVQSDPSRTAFADCVVDPSIVEAAMMSAQWLAARDGLWLPTGFAAMRVHPVRGRPRYAWIRTAGPERPDGAMCVDIAICGEDGTVCVEFRELELAPAIAATTSRDRVPLPAPSTAPVLEHPRQTPPARLADRVFHGRVQAAVPASAGQTAEHLEIQATLAKPDAIALVFPGQAAPEPQAATLDRPTVSLTAEDGGLGLEEPARVTMRDRGDGIFALHLQAADGRLDAGLVDALRRALAHACELPSLKALTIEGDDRVFLQGGKATLEDKATQALLRALASFPYPTAAVLSGQAAGAGFWLACVCDFVVAVEDQQYGLAMPDGPVIGRASQMAWLAARFGEPLAPLLAAAGSLFTGTQLREAGWGAAVVPRERLASTVGALRESLSDKSRNTLRLLKEHITREFEADAGLSAQDAPDASAAPAIEPAPAAEASGSAGHDAIELHRAEGNRLHLRMKAGDATPGDELLRQLHRALHACPDADVIVLHSEFDGFLPEDASHHGEPLREVLLELSQLRAPVIAVLERNAIDAGLLVALACNFAVYSEEGHYGSIDLQNHRGHPGLLDGLLALRFGAWAGAWALTGERCSGRELRQRMPLLHVCPAAEVPDRARALADRLCAFPRDVFGPASSLAARMPEGEGDSSAPGDSAAQPVQGDLELASTVVRASVDADGVVLVRLEDRDARNMFSDALIAGLQEVFDRIRASSAYKAVVLVGYDTYFASGGTRDGLKAIQEGKVRFTDFDVFQLPMRCPLPVVAAMQGHGIGAGWTLGLFSDRVLFSEESHYISPYMNFGFTPGAGATGVLPAKLGFDLARESLFTGREMPGTELARRNRLLTVLPRDRVLTEALALARELSRHSRSDLLAWKAASVAHRFEAWQALMAREVEMHEATLVGQADAMDRIEHRFGPERQGAADAGTRSAPTASASAPVDILPTIRRLLAEELRVDEAEIDPRTQFVDLGLDSISSVTWIRKINERFGLAIEATKVYSYSTLHQLAQYVGGQLSAEAQGMETMASKAPAAKASLPRASASRSPAVRPPIEAAERRSEVAAAAHPRVDLGAVRRTIIDLLAQELRQEPESIDLDRDFVELGLDSISGVTWIRAINHAYGTSVEATKVYTYPTLEKFARFLHDTLEQRAAQSTPVPAASAPPVEPPPGRVADSRAAATPAAARFFDWPALKSWRTNEASGATAAAQQAVEPNEVEIAVIGMAGRFPMAKDLDSFWDNIANARNCISEVPASRWDTRSYYVEGQPVLGQSNSKWMGVLEGHDRFDPLFFGLSPVEAEAMDPQQRIFLQCCWHGMENAGYTAERLSGSKCGVFVGCAYGDYNLLSREQRINALGFTGGATSILAARVSYFLNLQGPCISIDTACSSSLVAIATACDSLVTGASDTAFAGGVYVMANADMFLKTGHAGMLSPDGRCYTFDQRANGFVPGEGVGVVMLKRLADAERDGDRILGVVRGWGVNQDGRTNGITAPNAESQQRLINDVYDRFKIDPDRIELIEAHGTGTKLGDPIEIDGLKSAFRPATRRKQYCAIGSVKTNIGHCLTAAGVSGFIKLLLALQHRKLPPSINFETPNEHLDLDESPFFVNTALRDWDAPQDTGRLAAISSFGFSGTNAHLVLEEYTPRAAPAAASTVRPDAGFVVPLSARTAELLLRKASDLRDFVRADPDLDLAALACSLQMHRDAMDERLCFVAHGLQDVVDVLTAYIDRVDSSKPPPAGVFAAHVRHGRESVRLLSEDAEMASLVVDKCIADGNFEKLCELWVKGLALDWRRLHGARRPPMITLPPYPFAEDAYWVAPSEAAYEAMPPQRQDGPARHLHPLLQEKVADIRELGYRQATAEQDAAGETVSEVMRMHLPTYAFARMRCWIPSKDEARASAGTDATPGTPQQGRFLQNLDSIAELFTELEQDRLTAGEVAARVKQLA